MFFSIYIYIYILNPGEHLASRVATHRHFTFDCFKVDHECHERRMRSSIWLAQFSAHDSRSSNLNATRQHCLLNYISLFKSKFIACPHSPSSWRWVLMQAMVIFVICWYLYCTHILACRILDDIRSTRSFSSRPASFIVNLVLVRIASDAKPAASSLECGLPNIHYHRKVWACIIFIMSFALVLIFSHFRKSFQYQWCALGKANMRRTRSFGSSVWFIGQ